MISPDLPTRRPISPVLPARSSISSAMIVGCPVKPGSTALACFTVTGRGCLASEPNRRGGALTGLAAHGQPVSRRNSASTRSSCSRRCPTRGCRSVGRLTSLPAQARPAAWLSARRRLSDVDLGRDHGAAIDTVLARTPGTRPSPEDRPGHASTPCRHRRDGSWRLASRPMTGGGRRRGVSSAFRAVHARLRR